MTLLVNTPNNLSMYDRFYMLHLTNDMDIPKNMYTSCRETFCSNIRHKYAKDSELLQIHQINTRRMYVLTTHGKITITGNNAARTNISREMTKSLKIVNSFERNYK